MTKNDYYELKELMGVVQTISQQISTIRDIRQVYWEIDEMTPKELEEFLWDRKHIIENKIEQKLGIK
jgi:hypothetical protein